jgi:signal recognition particle receptor subunit beta
MKNVITSLALLIFVTGFSQTTIKEEAEITKTVKVENMAVVITVDSAEELESSFTLNDIEELLDLSEDNETVSFKIVCRGNYMSNGIKSSMSYKVEGNSNNSDDFLKSVEKIRTSAIKYYNSKN